VNKRKLLGIAILGLIVLAGVGWKFFFGGASTPRGTQIILKGLVGSEKVGFLEDEEVKKILNSRYGITLDFNKAGSLEMVREEPVYDFLFPSSQVAVEFYKAKGKPVVKDAVLFNSPIVFYSWEPVVVALERNGIVQHMNGIYYIIDMPKLVKLIAARKKWRDIGLPELYGYVGIISTDPLKSNSGNQFAALLAGILNNGEVIDGQSLKKVIPQVKDFFSRLGYLEHSSGVLFEQYLRMGVGSHPLIVGYENQIVEFAVLNKDAWEVVKKRLRILYPVPTVWSSHTVIAVNTKASGLISALEDRDIQRVAWERHGFRTGIIGGKNDVKVLGIVGMPERIDQVLPMPSPPVMQSLMDVLQSSPAGQEKGSH
jgi:hypothetical protein